MSNKSSNTLFAHIPEVEYKRLMEIEQKYYDLLAEREDISEYKKALEKLHVGDVVVNIEKFKEKYDVMKFHSIDSWDRMNMFTKVLIGEKALNDSLKRLYEVESQHRLMQDYNF